MSAARTVAIAIFALTAMIAAPLSAENGSYSASKRITVLQGFKAGGGSDALAQLVQPFLAKELGVTFVNQYIPGATGAIAWTKLAKQAPKDGSTISITNTPMLTANYIMNPAISYSVDDLTPLANVVTDPGIVVVAADSPFRAFDDFVATAKAKPNSVTAGNSGVGGDDYFTSLQFEREAGVSLRKVPFQGDGPSWTAAMGKKIDASFTNVSVTYAQIKEGNLRALVVFSERRLAELPNVPTAKELGYDLVSGSSRGYSGPAGFPENARNQIIDALRRVVENPAFQRAAAAQAMNVDFVAGDAYKAMLKKQETEYTKIWSELKDGTRGR